MNRLSTISLGLFWSVLFATSVVATDVEVTVTSGPDKLADQLRQTSLAAKTVTDEEANVQDIIAAARADYANLLGVLYAQASYGAAISIRIDGTEVSSISPLSVPSDVDQIAIAVDAGPRFRFATAEVSPLPPAFKIPEGFKRRRSAGSQIIQRTVQDAITAWRNAGYAKAQVADQSLIANHYDATVSVSVAIETGPKLQFGDLILVTESGVREARVRAIAGLPSGEVFSEIALNETAERLRRTGAFQSVILEETDTVRTGNLIDIIARLEPAPKRRFGVGAEVQSLEGLSLSGFWLHRNLLGGAERLRVEGEVGGIGGDSGGTDYTASIRYERPATFTPKTDLYLVGTLSAQDEPEFSQNTVVLAGGFNRELSDTLTSEAGIAYQYSDVEDADGASVLEHVFLPLAVTFDNRNDPVDPKSGYYTSLELAPFYGINQESGDGAWSYLDARTYLALGADSGTVFAIRGQLGSLIGAEAGAVPPNSLFFSGGSDTVRGQAFQSLGIETDTGTVGGRSFAAFSTELRYALNPTWSVVGFYDTGFIAADSNWSEDGQSHSGAGVGLRYNTTLGPLRFDVGTPVSGGDSGAVEIYIGIGQAF
ncbi:MAG: BamA/TamA family outer membrane protein [Pseudomonadota bacterium]